MVSPPGREAARRARARRTTDALESASRAVSRATPTRARVTARASRATTSTRARGVMTTRASSRGRFVSETGARETRLAESAGDDDASERGDGGGDESGGGGNGSDGDDRGGDGSGWRKRWATWIALAFAATRGSRGAKSKSADVDEEALMRAALIESFWNGLWSFYLVKLAFKVLWEPVLLVTITIDVFHSLGALSSSSMDVYNGLVRPLLPLEYQKSSADFSCRAVGFRAGQTALRDSWWAKEERRFWACAHRLNPASNSPDGEGAFMLGIIVALLLT